MYASKACNAMRPGDAVIYFYALTLPFTDFWYPCMACTLWMYIGTEIATDF